MKYTDKQLPLFWLLIPLIILLYFAVSYILKHPDNIKQNLLIMIILGYLIQMSFGFVEGKGIDGIRLRMVHSGHAEFARIATSGADMMVVAKNYEKLLDDAEMLTYPRTKPPGHLLFYLLTQKISDFVAPTNDLDTRYRNLVTIAAYSYPFVAYLVLIPLFFLCRFFMNNENSLIVCLFYLVIPSVTLVTLHLDQVLYPLLFVSGLFLAIYAGKQNNILISISAGAFIYFSLYFSFSLLPIIPLGLMLGASYIYCNSASDIRLKSLGRFFAGFLIGWVGAQFVFWLLLDYNILIRYQNAMSFHQEWKQWKPGVSNIIFYGLLNYVEFICWIGIPISILFLVNSRRNIPELIKGKVNLLNLTNAIVIAVFLILALFGKTKSEVGRLWIFMMPLVCLFSVSEFVDRFKKDKQFILFLILGLQFISVFVIKRFQDFW